MDALYSHFSQVLEQQRKANTRLVVAFSGGIDSRVLLELAHRYAQEHLLPCCAVHVHHGLSHNADQWVQSCAAWCQEKYSTDSGASSIGFDPREQHRGRSA